MKLHESIGHGASKNKSMGMRDAHSISLQKCFSLSSSPVILRACGTASLYYSGNGLLQCPSLRFDVSPPLSLHRLATPLQVLVHLRCWSLWGDVGVVRDNTRQPPIAQKPSKTMTADPSGRYPRAPVREPRGAGASGSTEDTPVKISGRGNSGKGRSLSTVPKEEKERNTLLISWTLLLYSYKELLMADAQTIYTNRWYVPIPLVISSHTKSSGYEGRRH